MTKNDIDFRILFESVPGLYLILDAELKIIAVNEAYAKATMTKRKEIIGRGLFDVFPDNPEDTAADGVSNLLFSLNFIRKYKKPHTMAVQKYDIRRPDGTFEIRYWSPLNTPVLNDKNEVIYIIHRVEDVTEFMRVKNEHEKKEALTKNLQEKVQEMEMEIFRRAKEIQKINFELEKKVEERTKEVIKNEKRFRALIEKSADMMTLATPEGQMLYISPSLTEILGFSIEEYQNSTGLEFIHPDDVQIVMEKIMGIISIPGGSFFSQHRLLHKNGSYRWCEGTFTNMLHDPDVEALVSNFRDITERKKAELEIINQNKILNTMNRELEQFAFVASHDLQEPLRSLISFTGLLKDDFKDKLDQNGEKYIEFILQSSKRMQELVKALLDYSRIGKERELVQIDCNILLQDVFTDMNLSISESKAMIKSNNLPVLKGFKVELRQLFQNLISNAIKFRKKDSIPEISISAKKQGEDWLFSVEDNGIGINPDDAYKIFIIFKRLHNRNEYEGTGIGLSHCKKIVELHGGHIWVVSKPGEGSTFYFTIS